MQEYNTHHFQKEIFKYSLLCSYSLCSFPFSSSKSSPLTVSEALIQGSNLMVSLGKPTYCRGTLGPVLTICKIKLFTNKV